jgi:hypothetical protein
MRKVITTIMLLALVDTSVAIAHAAGSRNRAAPSRRTRASNYRRMPHRSATASRAPIKCPRRKT